MPHRIVSICKLIPLCLVTALACAQAPEQAARPAGARADRGARRAPPLRPGLLFREEWQQSAKGGEHPATSESNGNADLDFERYVPAGQLLLEGSAGNENNPTHVWTGLCTSPCGVALRDKGHFADLSGLARIRVNAKMSGFHHLRPIVKLADGTWWVGDQAIGTTRDWLVSEVSYSDVRWLKFDIKRMVTVGNLQDTIDLTKVDEIGFADLKPSSGHGPGGWADIAQIEVYGRPVTRTGQN
ncbi:MAG TPA: hypothetical protein VHY19_02410 [Steroidobacteraceae bacterium]|nr:hypothetical protein [Steroidobacteraceae bacterium]